MKIIKITSMWCSACIIMNKIWNEINNKYDIDINELDYDIDEDEVLKYNPGKVLPVVIFLNDNNKEIDRIIGEKNKVEIIKKIEELGFSEKNS